MNATGASTHAGDACASCVRRAWLLAALGGPLEFCSRDRARLLALLALDDERLLDALGGNRRAQLRARYTNLDASALHAADTRPRTCPHRPGFPAALASAHAPRMLEVAGGTRRLRELLAEPVVAIVGSVQASDYGIALAHELARGLAGSGVTVLAAIGDGVAAAAHGGALECSHGAIGVLGGGLAVAASARAGALVERVRARGCVISELPGDCRARRWGQVASERIIAELAQLTLVVEARESAGELAIALLARELGRTVAAVPGRVTSPLAQGPHSLLRDGASLVRGTEDVLELLRPVGTCSGSSAVAERAQQVLDPRLSATLEQVGSGRDTPDALELAGADPEEVLAALSELELLGLLGRGHGGRYIPIPRPSG